MVKYNLSFPASPKIQTVFEAGSGRLIRVTLTHDQPTPQVVYFYDRLGQLIKEYQMPSFSLPATLSFANRDAFTFDDGLKILTGNCEVTLDLLH